MFWPAITAPEARSPVQARPGVPARDDPSAHPGPAGAPPRRPSMCAPGCVSVTTAPSRWSSTRPPTQDPGSSRTLT